MLSDGALSAFISLAGSDPDAATALLAKSIEKNRPQGGTEAEVLVDRLGRLPRETFTGGVATGVLIALANTMDMAAQAQGTRDLGRYPIWEAADALAKDLFDSIDDTERAEVVEKIYGAGRALGWLMNLMRSETFGHGRFGEQKVPESEWMLTEKELDVAEGCMAKRLQGDDQDRILNLPNLLSFLFGWFQIREEEAVRNWLENNSKTNDEMMELLDRCRGWLLSDKLYRPLNRRELGQIMDFNSFEQRLKSINSDPMTPEHERGWAKELLSAVEIGDKRGR